MAGAPEECIFCQIIRGKRPAAAIFEDTVSMAFLDNHPLFLGHALLVPKAHHQTLIDLPVELVQPFFANSQLLARAVQDYMGSEGTFIAINNRVSQSVPHLHVHVIPRKFGDGLKGFFWPRQRYPNDAAADETAAGIGRLFASYRDGRTS
jgi:histidine triad (HIT) family protein